MVKPSEGFHATTVRQIQIQHYQVKRTVTETRLDLGQHLDCDRAELPRQPFFKLDEQHCSRCGTVFNDQDINR